MALTPGTRLGPYEIAAQIGEGGMGEVYQATDTNLKRSVAIKVLPALVAGDAERLARFQREAEVLAALNHPNIAQIHGLEKSAGTIALVMELVEGPTLADRIAQGAIPVDEALPIAKQIAEALEGAHEQGIIHRDLKPANVKVRPDGTVKVLDFGLAKALEPTGAMSPGLSQAPTITTPAMTQAGMILGTAAYMSPEQAKGKPVDKRADVWAFGAVLYEMLTGRRAFQGDGVSETLARVIEREPDWTLLPSGLSPVLHTYIKRCLHKEAKQRVPDIAAMRLALEGAFQTTVTQAGDAAAVPLPMWRQPVPVAATAAVVALLVAGLAGWSLWPSLEPNLVTRFAYVLPDGELFRETAGRGVIAISPGGRYVAYTSIFGLHVRPMGELEGWLLPSTQGVLGRPFFSPDGEWVGYWNAADSELRRFPTGGGAHSVIATLGDLPQGVNWGRDDSILIGTIEGILRVSANGGTPELVIPAQPGEEIWGPQLLPDGESVLYSARQGSTPWDQGQVIVQSLRSGERTAVWQGGTDARYVSTGHLVYVQGDTVYAAAFDPDRLEVRGTPVPLVQGIRREAANTPTAQYAVSGSGTFVYVQGSAENSRILALVERTGTVHPLDLPPGRYVHPRLSPDGTQLTVGTEDDGEIWVYDLGPQGTLRRLTFGGGNYFPIWTLDGRYITFQSNRDGDFAIYRQLADGSGGAERLTRVEDGASSHEPESWSPDGTLSLDVFGAGAQGVWTLPAGGDGAPVVFVDEPVIVEKHSAFSPDGRWLAYMSTTEGLPEVFVQPFPSTGALYQLSTSQGRTPVWSRDGMELFFHDSLSNQLMVISVSSSPGFAFGAPMALPIEDTIHPLTQRNFDVTLDGEQFLVVLPASTDGGAPDSITVVLNWFEELRRLVPTE